MGDDGRGKSVHIPGVLISKSDGEILKTYYRNHKENIAKNPIYLEIDFEMETDENVNFDVYFEANDFNMLKTISNLKPYLKELGKTVDFEPRFVTYVHPAYNFTEFNKVEDDNCIAGGRYCVSPRGNLIKGKDVIKMNLKLKCAFNTMKDYKNKNGIGVIDVNINNVEGDDLMFFKLLKFFISDCLDNTKENYFSETCMAISLQKAGYDIKEINQCYADSFSPKGN